MTLFSVSLLGAFLALDGTSVGQFMVSRPLVAGVLTGWLVGAPATGLLVGAILEIYLLVALPVGGARFPEGATATVVAVTSAAWGATPGSLALGVALGLVWGQLGGVTTTALRTVNGALVPDPALGPVRPGQVVAGHLGAMALDFLRGLAVTATGVVVGRLLVDRFGDAWILDAADTEGLLLVGGAVSTGVLLRSFGGFRRRGVLFLGGLMVGALGAWLL